MRVLSDVVDDVEPDLSMREARIGDRYLLCSDGLSSVVSYETLQETMAVGKDPAATCEQLIQLALRSGAPDNVTCIVADIVDAAGTPTDTVPVVVGAASIRPQTRSGPGSSAAERAAELTAPAATSPEPHEPRPAPRSRSARTFRIGLATLLVLAVLGGGGYGAYRWSQGQYYVGDASGAVAIFRGLPQDLGPVQLSSVASLAPDVPIRDLPPYTRNQVQQGIVTDDERAAKVVVARLRAQAVTCRAATATPTATPTPTTKPTTKPPTKPPTTKAAKAPARKAAASKASTTAPTASGSAGATTPAGGDATAEDCRGLG
jgi:protein phosphatase